MNKMTDFPSRKADWKGEAMQKRIARRYAAERRFKWMGFAAVALSTLFLAFLLVTMLSSGLNGFRSTVIAVPFDFPTATGNASPSSISGPNAERAVSLLEPRSITETALSVTYGDDALEQFSPNAWVAVRDALVSDPDLVTQKTVLWLPANSEVDQAMKGNGSARAEAIVTRLKQQNAIETRFNLNFLTNSDGTDPTQVGIWGALKGSIFTMVVTLVLAFPIGVFSAIYLEEYAPKNRFSELIEVSINNLAAVPSIIFGLLGLVVFLEWFHLPRSAAIVGGLTLALMTMPVIVIASRSAFKAVPPSIREAALGVGASRVQVVFHHVLPLALPGIMTGTIIGMARALGETAPLLMIGMRAFTATPPSGLTDPATALPVQVFLWSDEVNRGFIEKTSAAIIVLLVFLLAMNAAAVYLRNRFETRW